VCCATLKRNKFIFLFLWCQGVSHFVAQQSYPILEGQITEMTPPPAFLSPRRNTGKNFSENLRPKFAGLIVLV
jgi:hypothetical protein